ncbi:MAG: hypothetical protein KKB50_03930 [Planctomycetes bacterium]|nr:hypothetical protein [Planctomycetota bacterium]
MLPKRRLVYCWRVACACGLLWAAVSAAADGRSAPRSTAGLLVDLARDHALGSRARCTAADVQHVRVLLRASARLDPGQSEAYIWLYELATLAGDEDDARRMLDELVRAAPGHQGAFARWLEAHVRTMQTLEERAAWLTGLLESADRPAELRALVHTHLARLAVQQLDYGKAQQQLARALELAPANPDVVRLALETLPPSASPEARLQAALRLVRVNPFDVDVVWEVALLLDQHGFADVARRFYDHALAVHGAAAQDAPVPAAHYLALSRNALARGALDAATNYAEQAVGAEPSFFEGRMYLHWLLTYRGHAGAAANIAQQLAHYFGQMRVPDEWPVQQVAQAAWFYCIIEKQPQRALMLAEAAARRAPHDVFVTRVLGWAQALNLRPEEAQSTLTPIAGKDAFAAYQLAKLLRDAGDEQTAAWVVRDLAYAPSAGHAHELLSQLGLPSATSQPAAARYPAVADALAAFDRELLDFYRDMGAFLEATVQVESRSPSPADAWRATFTLTNRARFPITLGPDGMVNPVFLLSFLVEGDWRREYAHLMTVNVDQLRVLRPGQSVHLTRSIDVGPLRRVTRFTPQQLQRITLTAILDPEQMADGTWRPSMTGQRIRPVYFNRLPAQTGREALHALVRALGGDVDATRFRAVEVLADLLGEKQRGDFKRLAYQPAPIPAERVQQALLAGLASESWELRARTLDALQVVGLDAALIRAAEGCLTHPHWLVRLMAVRLLARQGPRFGETARRMATEDADELVRELAASYVAQWQAAVPASQPAGSVGDTDR